jgi:hypothetical protein
MKEAAEKAASFAMLLHPRCLLIPDSGGIADIPQPPLGATSGFMHRDSIVLGGVRAESATTLLAASRST